ncbi:MAG: hypothetical protein HYW49_05110 [Deltaproteobacteria bacterium]|nr:hypothetical protein [Deltaproteobacteria bacterium]
MIPPEVLNAKPDPNNPNAPQSPLQEIQLADALNQGSKVMITPDGEIYAGTEQIAKIALAEFADPRLLRKTTSTMYSNSNPANVPKVAEKSRTRQGFLEMSNVNAVAELTNLLKANRMFESNMRAIRAYGDMSAKEANEVGKL